MISYLLVPLELQLVLWLSLFSPSSSSAKLTPEFASTNCENRCGKVTIPVPFWVGTANCTYDDRPFYEIFCNHSFDPPRPFLKRYNLEVADISNPGDGNTLTVRAPPSRLCEGKVAKALGVDFAGSPFRFSNGDYFLVEGCSGSVVLRNRYGQVMGGCASVCGNPYPTINLTNCNGIGCCQFPIQKYGLTQSYDEIGSDYFEIALEPVKLISPTTNNCTLAATVIDEALFEDFAGKLSDASSIPTPLQWLVTDSLMKTMGISHHVQCGDIGGGFQSCNCKFPYEGNPYARNGCQVIQQCRMCPSRCAINYYEGHDYYYCQKHPWLRQPIVRGFGSAMGLMLVVPACYGLYRLIKWRREIVQKAKHFKRNGGLLLQQQISSTDGVIDTLTIFTVIDLEAATDSFHKNRVLGQGGQGTVYKGMLIDGRIVAIKRSTKFDEGQLDQFINEMVILSQINHRNVVKLLGCCLETEVPLLVYEFIPNGTLYQHIHDPTEDFHLTWKMRLQIAAESAGALAYLHSSSSAPIYHRDIKSSNILLDEKYRSKVSDFGTSRAINIEETHVTTRILGTYGYLDPEYFQSNQFTEKSDVYSFGVVLVELITGRKPISPTESGDYWKSLAIEFLSQMENNPHLSDIVDTRVIEEGKEEEFIAVAKLAKKCLNMNGKQRPTMKEVSRILDDIRSPYSKQRATVLNNECMATEIKDNGPSTSSSDMFYSVNRSFSSVSIEVNLEQCCHTDPKSSRSH